MKEVTVAITMNSSFIRLLVAKVHLAGLHQKDPAELDPAGVLALVICAEARGGLEADVAAMIPQIHRGDLRVNHDLRSVREIPTTRGTDHDPR